MNDRFNASQLTNIAGVAGEDTAHALDLLLRFTAPFLEWCQERPLTPADACVVSGTIQVGESAIPFQLTPLER